MQEMSSLRSSSVCLRTRAGLPRPHLGALKLQGEKRSGQKRPVPTTPPAGAAVPHKPADAGPWAQSGLPSARHHVSEGQTLGGKCKPTTHSIAVICFHVVVSHFQLNSTKPINMGQGKYPKVRVRPGPGVPKANGGRAGAHLVSHRGLLMEQILDSETQRRRGVAFRPGAPSSSCSLLTPPKPLVRPETETQAPEVAGQSNGPLRTGRRAVARGHSQMAPRFLYPNLSTQHRADDIGDTRTRAEQNYRKFKSS